jgi:outer membrane protein assembly factor BamD (BamD/ComL family)
MKIIGIRMREIQAPDRNDKDIQKAQAEAAEAEIRKFLEMFPNSDYAPAARQYLEQITAQKTAEAA